MGYKVSDGFLCTAPCRPALGEGWLTREDVLAGVMWELPGNTLGVTEGAQSASSMRTIHTASKIRDRCEGRVLPVSQPGFGARHGTGCDYLGPENIDVSNLSSSPSQQGKRKKVLRRVVDPAGIKKDDLKSVFPVQTRGSNP